MIVGDTKHVREIRYPWNKIGSRDHKLTVISLHVFKRLFNRTNM